MVRAPAWPELTWRIHYAQATSSADTGNGASTLALKPMGRVSLSPKREHQWLHKMVTCHCKTLKKSSGNRSGKKDVPQLGYVPCLQHLQYIWQTCTLHGSLPPPNLHALSTTV